MKKKGKLISRNNKSNKRGLSTVIVTLLLILLSLVAVGVIWVFVSNTVNTQIANSQSCFGNFEKIKLNEQYTCYERINSTHYNLRFSIGIGDINLDSVIVSIASASTIKSYELKNTPQLIGNLSMYPSGEVDIVLPGKNEGLTYNATGFSAMIDSITISPVIGGSSCGVSDSISDISSCEL
jgi:hypothetical protein